MPDSRLFPMTFQPVLRDYIWGGRRFETLFGRQLPSGVVAESWEISGHPSGSTKVDWGYWQGRDLVEVQAQLGEALVGSRAGWALERRKFPLLVKLLDAQQDLSVQVHPDDRYATEHEGGELGKTEMWYVLHADPGASLIVGAEPGVTRASFCRALEHGRLNEVLRRVPVLAGQAVMLPARTVHALLSGVVVTEIQQNSDTTYRVYDWDRVDAAGRPRPLHVERAMDVIDFDLAPQPLTPILEPFGAGLSRAELARSPYFVVEKVGFDAGAVYGGACTGESLEIWGALEGQLELAWDGGSLSLPGIRYALLPASMGRYTVHRERKRGRTPRVSAGLEQPARPTPGCATATFPGPPPARSLRLARHAGQRSDRAG